MKVEFTDQAKAKFKEGLEEFKRQVDECVKGGGTTAGTSPSNIIKIFDEALQEIEYKSNVEFGSGKLKKEVCGVGFVRKDILKDDYVNGSSFTHKKGAYIFFTYNRKDEEFKLCIGGSENDRDTNNCKAMREIEQKRGKGEFEKQYGSNFDAEIIANDFIEFANDFNRFSVDDFKIIENKGESTMPDELNKIPLNQILYGPPGTGKTYSTIDKALEILKSFDCIDEIPQSREEKREIFNAYKEKGQIRFITFHQSFSYEEFVKGIKPIFVDENGDEVENSTNMVYKPKDGIFKEICNDAKQYTKEFGERLAKSNNKPYTIDTTKTLWRLYTIPNADRNNDYFDECIKNNYVKVFYDYGGVRLKDEVKEGDYIAIPSTRRNEMSKTIRAFGILKGMKDDLEGEKNEFARKVEWLWSAKDESEILEFDEGVNFSRPTFQRVGKTGKEEIFEFMQKLLGNRVFETKPYILIIDEINRGNISKILGELITLIEESKRIGEKEELKVRLPYSNEEFGVPSNLYIIGTMNTADRSIALLDTALRRRFEFVEMMPDCSLLSTDCEGVNLRELLKVMNDRIEFLLDREHTIGHSFFIGITSIEELKEVFAKKIIPLLQEYFYEDYAKIDAVLNGNGMVEKVSKSVASLFQKSRPDDLEDKIIYNIAPLHSKIWDNPQTYKNIYNSKVENSQDSNESNENGE